MSKIREAAEYGLEFISRNPNYADKVNDLFKLLKSEIEEESSPEQELESFKESVNQLLEK